MNTKTGLQKPISSIFSDMPKTDDGQKNISEVPSASSIPASQSKPEPPSTTREPEPENTTELPVETPTASTEYAELTPVQIDHGPKERIWLKRLLVPFTAVILTVLFVAITANYMGVFTKYDVKTAIEPVVIQKPQIVQAVPVIDWEIPEEIPASSRDITQQKVADGNGDGEIIVKGILHSEDNTLAIIGSQILKAGDTVGGATIISIDRRTVEFMKDDKSWTQAVQ